MFENCSLDKSTPIPLYYSLKNIIKNEIDNGNYPPGSMIPTENEISNIFKISRTTVRQAILELVQEGKLYRIRSKGTFIAKPKIIQGISNTYLNGREQTLLTNRIPSTIVLEFKVVTMPDFMLEICSGDSDSKAIFLYRKRLADNEPIMRNISYMSYDKCSFVLNEDFSKKTIHEVLNSNANTQINRIERIIESVPAGPEDEKVLDMEIGSPVQKIITMRYNSKDELLEYSFSYYRGDQHKIYIKIDN